MFYAVDIRFGSMVVTVSVDRDCRVSDRVDIMFPIFAVIGTLYGMMCGHEMVVPDGLPMCLRILVLVNTDKDQEEIQHVYLKGAIKLRSRGLDQ